MQQLWPKTPLSGLKAFFCIFWNSFGVLHDRFFEMSPTVTHNTYYYKLTNTVPNTTSKKAFPFNQFEKERTMGCCDITCSSVCVFDDGRGIPLTG